MRTKQCPLFGSSGSQCTLLNGGFDAFPSPENLSRISFPQGGAPLNKLICFFLCSIPISLSNTQVPVRGQHGGVGGGGDTSLQSEKI